MKQLLILFLLIASNAFTQNTIATKDIADIVLPNPEVELFYGHVNYSADYIVVLPEHVVIYSAEKASFYLLDKNSKLNLDKLSLFDLKHIVTKRRSIGSMVNGKYRPYTRYKTPFVTFNILNDMEMYALSDTSVYGGLIRIKRDIKIVKLFVKNDSLSLDLIDYDIKKSFRKISKKEKRKKIKFDRYDAQRYSDYTEFGDKQIFCFGRSPYQFKKGINYKEHGRNYMRDSLLYFNAVFYKTRGNDSLKLLYQNTYNEIAAIYPIPKHGYSHWPNLYTSRNRLILRTHSYLDSLVIFDKDLKKQFSFHLRKEIYKAFPGCFSGVFTEVPVKTNNIIFTSTKIFKDEFTEKLYVTFSTKEKATSIISELIIDEKNKLVKFRYLRSIKYSGAWVYPLTVNKGILYLGSENSLVGNKYVYSYDLYKGLANNKNTLEIKFRNVIDQNKKNHNNDVFYTKYEKHKPLGKKVRKKYFKEIKRDTSIFAQSTHLELLKSLKKTIINDTINYALSYLMSYSGIDRIEIEDDMKAKNFLYFELMTEHFSKEKALSQINYFVEEFDSFDTQMYRNKMMVKTPDGIFFNLFKLDGLWYLDPTLKVIRTESIE